MSTCALLLAAAVAAPPDVSRFELDNGIRVVVLQVAGSERCAVVSCLPLGLTGDGPDRTQWSHLVEHLTLRTTGPITDYRTRNAETMADTMHLDWMGPAETWTEGLDLHAAWLASKPFTEETLRDEVPKALSELDGTVPNGFTGKWAMAAWAQAVRHGRTDIRVRGALADAKLEDVQAYRDAHLVDLGRTLVCVVGGVDPPTVRREITHRLGGLKTPAAVTPAASNPAAPGSDLVVTWDLAASHYIEAWPIPGPGHDDYPALYVASMMFMQPQIVATVDWRTPESNWLTVSTSIRTNRTHDDAKRRIVQGFERLAGMAAAAPMLGRNLAMRFAAPQDPGSAGPGFDPGLVEANVGLQWAFAEHRHGEGLADLPERLAAVTAEDLQRVVETYLTQDRRITLLIRPPDDS